MESADTVDNNIKKINNVSLSLQKTITSSIYNVDRNLDDTISSSVEKPKKMKKIVESEKWSVFQDFSCSLENQLALLDSSCEPQYQLLVKLVSTKQQGYKCQDKQKNLFQENKFIQIDQIFSLLRESRLLCFYCVLPVKLIYEQSRDMKQWSLERIDNSYGHNYDNVVLACLDCNLRRRTMFQDRYKKTKEMYHVVKLA